MPVREVTSVGLEHWPPPEELAERVATGGVFFLPDDVSDVDGETVAAFRETAQALRVRASKDGVPVEFVAPAGARLGVYRERAAEWILPFVLSIPAGVAINLVANEIQRFIDSRRRAEAHAPPSIRYREAIIQDGRTTVRELIGPADEVLAILRGAGTPEISHTQKE